MDEYQLGEKIGKLTEAITSQQKATEDNTAVLRGMETRLIKGDARMDSIDSRVTAIDERAGTLDNRVDTLPCKSGQPLPPNCPVISSQTPEPTTDLAADAAKWRWVVSGLTFLRTHWQGLGIAGLLSAVFGEKAFVFLWKLFGGGPPPAH